MLQHRPLFIVFILCMGLGLLSGCSSTKHLPEGSLLLRKVNIKLSTDKTLSDKSALSDQLYSLIPQQPNNYFLGKWPVKIWLYNMRYKKYVVDTTNFQIKNKVVEKPVALDTFMVEKARKNMSDFLWNSGYFYANVTDTIKVKGKKAYVTYKVNTGTDYLVNDVNYDIEDSAMAQLTDKLKEGTLFAKGKSYNNTLAGAERSRLVNEIKNYGYYHFNAANIEFELDTLDKSYFKNLENPFESAVNFITLNRTKKKPTLDVKVSIHKENDSLSFQKYTIGKVLVIPDYLDTSDIRDKNMTEKIINNLTFRYHTNYVHTSILEKKIFIRPGNVYSQSDYSKTLRQLNDLGVFQYVRVFLFADKEDTLNHTLNCYIFMNRNERFTFGTNVEASSGDLYVIGSAANVSVTDKNFLHGANELTATASYGVELRQNNEFGTPFFSKFYVYSQNLGLNFKLTFPKFILPINQSKFSQNSVPKTVFNFGVNLQDRYDYFKLLSINASYGYVWKETATKAWSVKPVFVNTQHLQNISENFQARLDSIPAIRNSYQETFIEGEGIEFVINTEGINRHKYFYLRLAGEEAGGLVSAVKGLAELGNKSLDFTHSRYVRLDFDTRQYLVRRNSLLALRFYGGVGIPYGGSTILPYIKQYFVGGAYSIRGWNPRTLGPGSYYDSALQNSVNSLYVDQAGDIKLEFNAEYRFAMFKMFSGAVSLNGAVFTDMGNIWLAQKDPSRPGAQISLNHLYQDIALSSGAGLRMDIGGILVVRADWAAQLKKPYVAENGGWVIKQVDLGDPDWRKKNLNFLVAIGYPF